MFGVTLGCLLAAFVYIWGSFLMSFGGCFGLKRRNVKSVFGLHRRVRIACATCQKTVHLGDFECFKASETGLFLASLFTAVLGSTFMSPGCVLVPNGPPIGATLGAIGW